MKHTLGHNAPPLLQPSLGLSNWLLEALRRSEFGLAIYNRQLRIVAFNDAVAKMDRVPAEEHLGRETFEIAGAVSRAIDPRVERVFRTGKPSNQYELSARLPTGKEVGYWIVDFIPIKDDRGRVREVGVLAFEITKQKRLEAAFRHLRRSVHAGAQIRDEEKLLALMKAGTMEVTGAGRKLPPGSSPAGLSPRQLEVLRLLALGRSNKQVASALAISEKTVETHRSRIMLKLGLRSLVEMTRYAIRHGIVDP